MAAAASSASVASSAYYVPSRKREAYRVQTLVPSFPRNTHARQQLQRRRQLVIRSSGEESATAVEEEEPQSPVEVSKGPPSLISALNVEKALRGLGVFFF